MNDTRPQEGIHMRKTSIALALMAAALGPIGCVVKTSGSSEPASPSPATSPTPEPASPAPAPTHAAAPAPAPAQPAPVHPATPAPAPTANPASPPPVPAPKKEATAGKTAKPAQPAFAPPPKPKEKPSERKASDAIGAPPNLHPGAPLAYWIWKDAKGNGWHLRTTAPAKDNHRFSGRVWVDGTLSDLKPTALEGMQDRLKKEDEGVLVFDFLTGGASDGFDFQVASGRCVTFHLLVDGKPAPKEVEIGQKEIPAGSATFRLCR